ncbi:MAG TPA: alpha/beta hydrolase [Burkholderiales bacterium]|nr:alpha/beta hydrolase [Burkholderiales bacterium]
MDFGSLAALIKVVAAVVVALPLTAYLMQDKLIFQPRPLADAERQAIASRHPDVADIFLQAADGTRLHAWHVKSSPEAPLVLYFGGNAEEVSWMLDELPRRDGGVSWLLADYRGYGSSGGSPSEQALESDAAAWYDHFAATNPRILAFGRSLGSGVAVHLAAERKLEGIVLVAPFDSMVQVGKRHYPFLPVDWFLKHRFDSLSLAPRLTTPLLCIVATHDQVIPAEHAQRLYEAWAGPKKLVALAAGHNSIDGHPDYWPSIRAFLPAR